MGYLIKSIFPDCAALLNDAAQTDYTNDVLLPFARLAADELQLELEENGILALEKKSPIIKVPQGTVDMQLAGLLPLDMLEPQRVDERLGGSTDLFMLMTRRQWEPEILPTDSLRYWDYREENIFFVGATTDRDIKLFYLKRLVNITSENSLVSLNNSQQFLTMRIAGLGARFIGENPTRADQLDGMAGRDLEKLIGIGVKSKQGTRTRRRPFIINGRRGWV